MPTHTHTHKHLQTATSYHMLWGLGEGGKEGS